MSDSCTIQVCMVNNIIQFIDHTFYVKLSWRFFNCLLKTFKKILIFSLLPPLTNLTLLGNQQWILKGQCAPFLRNFEPIRPNAILIQFWLRYINILHRLSWTYQHFSFPMTTQGYPLPFFFFFRDQYFYYGWHMLKDVVYF